MLVRFEAGFARELNFTIWVLLLTIVIVIACLIVFTRRGFRRRLFVAPNRQLRKLDSHFDHAWPGMCNCDAGLKDDEGEEEENETNS